MADCIVALILTLVVTLALGDSEDRGHECRSCGHCRRR